jgi:hypothetical protein
MIQVAGILLYSGGLEFELGPEIGLTWQNWRHFLGPSRHML